MTNNEAISRIKFLLDVGGSDGFTSSDRDALNTAINVLSDCMNPKTNGDKIRQMSDEQLAEILCFADCEMGNTVCPAINNRHCNGDCCGHFLRWLKKEIDEDAGTD